MICTRAGRHCVPRLLLLLLLLLLSAACWAYQVVDIVEGKLAADESNQYTVDTFGILVGMLATWSEQEAWLMLVCLSDSLHVSLSLLSCAAH